jgi:hypothetical protein
MARVHPEITPALRAFIERQPLYFVASAPIAADGHVNLSPKGLDSFRVLGPRRVAYLDLTGSGNETAAHLAQNGRITVMFCAFSGAPQILRLYGRGRAVLPGEAGWAALEPLFPAMTGVRQVIEVEVERVQTSCGFGVPRMERVADRDHLIRWAEAKEDLSAYRRERNATSIDGLPAPVA